MKPRLHDSEILLDLAATDLPELIEQTLDRLTQLEKISKAQRQAVEQTIKARGTGPPWDLGYGVGVLRIRYEGDVQETPRCALVRVPEGVRASDHERIHFLWIVLTTYGAPSPKNEELEPFGWMLHDEQFSASILGANDPMQVLATYQLYLEYVEAPPAVRRPSLVPSYPSVEAVTVRGVGAGLLADVRRRLPSYASDFTDALSAKGLASVLFIYFACLAPSVAFGGLLDYLTDGQIGTVETVLAAAVAGVLYALLSGQPLTLLGTTGPVAVFLGLLYGLCKDNGVPYLAGLFWVGVWTALFLLTFSLTNASRFIRWFTRFTDEIFGGLIALIFIVAALQNVFRGFFGPVVPTSGQLLALILALGTYLVAQQLSRMRQKPLLTQWVREFLADFGPAIAILSMTALAHVMRPIELPHLHVPQEFATTSGRNWLVNPMDAPIWFWAASIPIAALSSVLLYLDQNITVRLVNSPHNRLRKGAGYDLDMAVIAVTVALFAVFGLPWVIAATVRSLNHVRSLADVSHHADGEHIISVRENRLTALVVSALLGLSLVFLNLLREVPMSVIFGLFLFMGIASTRGNQFVDRMKLWVTDPALYPPTHYVRRVPPAVIHAFTGVQSVCLAILWFVKESTYGVLFPLCIALLVPVRHSLNRFFSERHLGFLDADEIPEEEQYREMD